MTNLKKMMIETYKISELGYDQMGYTFTDDDKLAFHHLIIPRRCGGATKFENGSILVQSSSHDYLHAIERLDLDMFYAITKELIDESVTRSIKIANLKAIRDVLICFEREYSSCKTKCGKPVIKEHYITDRIKIK